MAQKRAIATREKLIQSATELIRRLGYAATSIDDICGHARVTKGAFFHHFKSKEELVEGCLEQWNLQGSAMLSGGEFRALPNPRQRLAGCMDFFIGMLDDPQTLKSCLAGTVVQEVADSHPGLRGAANACFVGAVDGFRALIDDALGEKADGEDTTSLAALWMAGIQGSFILAKASGDPTVVRATLEHLKTYILSRLPAASHA